MNKTKVKKWVKQKRSEAVIVPGYEEDVPPAYSEGYTDGFARAMELVATLLGIRRPHAKRKTK